MTQESLAKKKGIADIVFLIDVSGSMQPCLDALKENVGVLIDTTVNPGANAAAIVKDWRIKVCGYRDANADGDQWWVEMPFTTDAAQVKADLASLVASGGGDEPESLLDGMWKLAKLPETRKGEPGDPHSWRYHSDVARCVIVFTDATSHMSTSIPEAGGAVFDDVAREVMNARIRLSVYAPEAECYVIISGIDKSEFESIGTLSNAQEAMVAFSRDTSNFKKTMEQLAKSISVSSETPAL